MWQQIEKSAVQLRVEKTPAWIRNLYFSIFALLPWSVEYSFGAWKMYLPAEPLIACAGIGLGGWVLKNAAAWRAAFSGNFLLFVSAVWVAWLTVSACFSTMPLESWKYWVVEAGQWWVFAVGMSVFPDLFRRAIAVFAFSMATVVVYTLIHHSFYHFRADQSLLAPMPFFPEHTLYAAVLGLVLFALWPLLPAFSGKMGRQRILSAALVLLFVAGLFFSFSRAALISVLFAGLAAILLVFREKWRVFVVTGIFLSALAGIFHKPIIAGIKKELAGDVSAAERLNRYACALRMVRERPRTGFGPGTFQFQYIPFQRADEMTRISVATPAAECSPDTYGRGGGAHSEFFQALAENGWPGLALWVILVVSALWMGFDKGISHPSARWAVLGLLTFFVHGLVNNMLHDGRVAALVWGMVATIGARVGRMSRKYLKIGCWSLKIGHY